MSIHSPFSLIVKKLNMSFLAFVFVRRNAAVLHAGHVGWGFQLDDGLFFCGATENPVGNALVLPGGNNGWWGKKVQYQEEMFNEMKARCYDEYKWIEVKDGDSILAYKAALATAKWGYTVLGNNCLDHTYAVLFAYKVKNLPLKQFNIAPNDWYDKLVGGGGSCFLP